MVWESVINCQTSLRELLIRITTAGYHFYMVVRSTKNWRMFFALPRIFFVSLSATVYSLLSIFVCAPVSLLYYIFFCLVFLRSSLPSRQNTHTHSRRGVLHLFFGISRLLFNELSRGQSSALAASLPLSLSSTFPRDPFLFLSTTSCARWKALGV